ncbi:hypothetical protein [Ruminococcus sp.]|jgi:hypothetical protein|uniref:hypothetical protein n=1 Tax=Ruminococcus sp. TaxID=41978 RepID=UPI0025E15AB3|nr:hypothetical protein [Ruminococcus sp.]
MSEKKTTEMNELLEEANEMSLGEEAGGGITPSVIASIAACGPIITTLVTKGVVCYRPRTK